MNDTIHVGDIVRIDGSSLHPDWNGKLAVVVFVVRSPAHVVQYHLVGDDGATGAINAEKVSLMMRPIPSSVMDDTREYLEAITTQEVNRGNTQLRR